MMADHESIPSLPPPRSLFFWLRFSSVLVGITVVVLLILTRGNIGLVGQWLGQASWTPHLPDLRPIAAGGPLVWIHLATVGGALILGIVLLVGPKGRRLHRTLGWIWASFMVATAIDTLFLRTSGAPSTPGGFTFLHIFSVWTLISAPLGIYLARRHNVLAHRGVMTGLFFGGLVAAGLLAFLPGRTMYAVVFG